MIQKWGLFVNDDGPSVNLTRASGAPSWLSRIVAAP